MKPTWSMGMEEKLTTLKAPPHSKSVAIRIIKGEPSDMALKPSAMQPPEPTLKACKETLSQWKLDKGLNLAALAADFYTLIDLQCDYPWIPEINISLARLTALLAKQFSAYLDMVIGGELRHAWGNTYHYDADDRYHEHECYESIFAMPISKIAKEALKDLTRYDNYEGRNPAWKEWKAIREKFGIDALKGAREIFNLDWEDGYGGESWANATTILLDYLNGGLTALAFVDTCFGLHHNNNIILDKVWVVGMKLKDVLNFNLNNRMAEVSRRCSPKVKKLIRRFRK